MNKRVLCLILLILLCQEQGFLLGLALMTTGVNWGAVCFGQLGALMAIASLFYYLYTEKQV